MKKEDVIKQIASRNKLEENVVKSVMDELIAEMASPFVFPERGGEVGFINDNNCKNNCKEGLKYGLAQSLPEA